MEYGLLSALLYIPEEDEKYREKLLKEYGIESYRQDRMSLEKWCSVLRFYSRFIEKDIVPYMPDRVKNEIIEKWISLCYDNPKLFVRKRIQNRRIPLISRKGLE